MSFATYRDDFEARELDRTLWRTRQISDRQISFTNDAASGAKSVTVTVKDGDGDNGTHCTKPCQRAEIRTKGHLRPEHADEFWQSFAFKATGDIAPVGSLRTVLGQWKAPGDQSPFLAQRFDNGVFHVTVQDGENRRIVAAAEGDPNRLETFQDLIASMSKSAPGLAQAAKSFVDLRHFSDLAPELGADALRPGQLGLLNRAAEVLRNFDHDPDEELFEEFCFVNEIDCFAGGANMMVNNPGQRKLPDPKADWVHMAYRIKAGRRDNHADHAPRRLGEVDIYANGELIAEVRGDLGYQVTEAPRDPTIYFKFGVYRDLTQGVLRFQFDNFRQGASARDVM